MIKIIKFLEKMWLMLAIVTFLIGIYRSIQYSVFDALYFFGFSVVSIFLFSIRRKQRRYHEHNNKS
ncbi:MAG: hypothetical protein DWP98_05405 [Bacteroidetes bacterium]|nr:MAG: hypothetical protein DWP98_05405 [Bacteroidota bacterium]MBL1143464.1 hypothetical protein [Bacteroidota bacterium]